MTNMNKEMNAYWIRQKVDPKTWAKVKFYATIHKIDNSQAVETILNLGWEMYKKLEEEELSKNGEVTAKLL